MIVAQICPFILWKIF